MPEKVIAAVSVSTALAILFSGKNKKSSKRKNFVQRIERNYKIVDNILSMTIAKEVQKEKTNEEKFKTKLKDLKIENAEIIDL